MFCLLLSIFHLIKSIPSYKCYCLNTSRKKNIKKTNQRSKKINYQWQFLTRCLVQFLWTGPPPSLLIMIWPQGLLTLSAKFMSCIQFPLTSVLNDTSTAKGLQRFIIILNIYIFFVFACNKTTYQFVIHCPINSNAV